MPVGEFGGHANSSRTVQAAVYDGKGRRIKKAVSNSVLVKFDGRCSSSRILSHTPDNDLSILAGRSRISGTVRASCVCGGGETEDSPTPIVNPTARPAHERAVEGGARLGRAISSGGEAPLVCQAVDQIIPQQQHDQPRDELDEPIEDAQHWVPVAI